MAEAQPASKPGDLLVRQAPACTIEGWRRPSPGLLGIDEPKINAIGCRHGEKLYEMLLSNEE